MRRDIEARAAFPEISLRLPGRVMRAETLVGRGRAAAVKGKKG